LRPADFAIWKAEIELMDDPSALRRMGNLLVDSDKFQGRQFKILMDLVRNKLDVFEPIMIKNIVGTKFYVGDCVTKAYVDRMHSIVTEVVREDGIWEPRREK
jgi:hypothetical protein